MPRVGWPAYAEAQLEVDVMLRLVAQRRMRLTAAPLALAGAAFAVGASGFIATLDRPNYTRALSPLPELKWDVAMAHIGPQLEPFPGPGMPTLDLAATIEPPAETEELAPPVRYASTATAAAASKTTAATPLGLPRVARPAAVLPQATPVAAPAEVEVPVAVAASVGEAPRQVSTDAQRTPVADPTPVVPTRPATTPAPAVTPAAPAAVDDGNKGRGNDDKEKSKPEKAASDDAPRGKDKK